MPSIPDLLFLLANDLLDGASTALAETSSGAPERKFVTYDGPVDECSQLTVRFTGMEGFPQGAGIAGQRGRGVASCEMSSLATYKIRLVRCVAEGPKTSGPTPEQQTGDAETLLEDTWAIWMTMVKGKIDKTLFTSVVCPCSAVGVGPLVPVPRRGGMAGLELTVTVQADELAAAAGS